MTTEPEALADQRASHETVGSVIASGSIESGPSAVGKLSGGMKQKLGLCCALIHDPDLLILDEPTTGVDPLARRQFWDLIQHIRSQRAGMSVIVATAYMEGANQFDWLIAMDAGKVLTAGTPLELLARTKTLSLDEAFLSLLPEERRADLAVVWPQFFALAVIGSTFFVIASIQFGRSVTQTE